jgi:hypothetical protein
MDEQEAKLIDKAAAEKTAMQTHLNSLFHDCGSCNEHNIVATDRLQAQDPQTQLPPNHSFDHFPPELVDVAHAFAKARIDHLAEQQQHLVLALLRCQGVEDALDMFAAFQLRVKRIQTARSRREYAPRR